MYELHYLTIVMLLWQRKIEEPVAACHSVKQNTSMIMFMVNHNVNFMQFAVNSVIMQNL